MPVLTVFPFMSRILYKKLVFGKHCLPDQKGSKQKDSAGRRNFLFWLVGAIPKPQWSKISSLAAHLTVLIFLPAGAHAAARFWHFPCQKARPDLPDRSKAPDTHWGSYCPIAPCSFGSDYILSSLPKVHTDASRFCHGHSSCNLSFPGLTPVVGIGLCSLPSTDGFFSIGLSSVHFGNGWRTDRSARCEPGQPRSIL